MNMNDQKPERRQSHARRFTRKGPHIWKIIATMWAVVLLMGSCFLLYVLTSPELEVDEASLQTTPASIVHLSLPTPASAPFSSEFLSAATTLCTQAFENISSDIREGSIPGRAVELECEADRCAPGNLGWLELSAQREGEVTAIFCLHLGDTTVGQWVPLGEPIPLNTLESDYSRAYFDTVSVRVVSWPGGELLASASFVGTKPLGEGIVSYESGQTARDMYNIWQHSLRWEMLGHLPDHALKTRWGISNLIWSPEGHWLATTDDHAVDIWDTDKWRMIHQSLEHGSEFAARLAFSPDGQLLAAGISEASGVILWDVESGQPVNRFPVHSSRVCSVRFSLDGALLAATSVRGLHVWSRHTGEELVSLRDPMPGGVCRPSPVSPDFRRWVGPSGQVWNVEDKEVFSHLRGYPHSPAVVVWSPDGRLVAVARLETGIQLWEVENSEEIIRWEGFNPSDLAFHPGGQFLLSLVADQPVVLRLDVQHPDQVARLHIAETARHILLSPNGYLLVVEESISQTGEMWNIETEVQVARFSARANPPAGWPCAFSPDGMWLACFSNDGHIYLWALTQEQ
jgi:WD40 repeat protein